MHTMDSAVYNINVWNASAESMLWRIPVPLTWKLRRDVLRFIAMPSPTSRSCACTLQEDERNLDQCIQQLENCVQVMTDDPANRARLYVTEEDIAELPIVSSETVFAVKAAQGTTLEVPDPDDGPDGANERRYRCLLMHTPPTHHSCCLCKRPIMQLRHRNQWCPPETGRFP